MARQPNKPLTAAQQSAYLMSFLMILVHRAGGEMTIEKLSEFSNRHILLGMEIFHDADKVVLKTVEEVLPKGRDS